MAGERKLPVKTVGVIGAGVGGIASAVHLSRVGLDVTVFERSDHIGGIWYFDERVSADASYPAIQPSIGDSPEYETSQASRRDERQDSPIEEGDPNWESASLAFAPPGPCYAGLRNNVSTHEMEMSGLPFKPDTEDFINQKELATYLQEFAAMNKAHTHIQLNTRVEDVRKVGREWKVETTTLSKTNIGPAYTPTPHHFDAVIVANGSFHAMNIPDIPGLPEWKAAYPDKVQHSKLYRHPEKYRDQHVLLVGAGVSSTDIVRELSTVAKSTYQSSRGGKMDMPTVLLPDDCARVAGIKSFDPLVSTRSDSAAHCIPGTVTLTDGRVLTGIDSVILATGYHTSLPFLRHLHSDSVQDPPSPDTVLVTDGHQTHNLHKDIFYIPDPTLSFVGVPLFTATWSFFEFQAMALAQVLAGKVSLPSEGDMRQEYAEKLAKKGPGRAFHSMKGPGVEVGYVNDLVDWVNHHTGNGNAKEKYVMKGHSEKWMKSYARRQERFKLLFGPPRAKAVDEKVLAGMPSCV